MSSQPHTELEISKGRAKGVYRVIDARNKPPVARMKGFFLEAQARVQPQGWHPGWRLIGDTIKTVNTSSFGTQPAIDMWIAELEAAHIDFVVTSGRVQKLTERAGELTTEDILPLIEKYPNKIAGLAPINLDQDLKVSIDELEKALASGMRGANIENGYRTQPGPISATDPSLFPIYELLSAQDRPVQFLTGPFNGSKTRLNNADVFDDLLTQFPKLKVIVAHGGYPYMMEMMGCAYKHPNFFIIPDLYAFCPGGELYISNMDKLPDQFLFGTGYPIGSMAEMVGVTSEFDIDKSVMENYLCNNAVRAFGLA